jgi:lipid A 4'-phosphatase
MDERVDHGLKEPALQPDRPLRSYLALRRTQAILACFAASAILLVLSSGLDLQVSRLFFHDGFYMAQQRWTQVLHASVTWVVVGSISLSAAVYLVNRLTARRLWGLDGRKLTYLLLVLALGSGFMVNGMLKEGFGRARPRELAEFGGTADFTPAFLPATACSHNCSFSSGDSAGAFFTLSFAYVFTRRRALMVAAVAYGLLVSLARIAAGAHFLSDTVVSFFVMLIASDAFHYRLFLFRPAAARAPALPAEAPAAIAAGSEPLLP